MADIDPVVDKQDDGRLEVRRYEHIFITYHISRAEAATKIIDRYQERGFEIEDRHFSEKEKEYEVMLSKYRIMKK